MTTNDISPDRIAECLEQSLSPQWAKEAEFRLKNMETFPGFSVNLLNLVASHHLSLPVHLAGALYFKNLIRRKYMSQDGVRIIPVEDAICIKRDIIRIMTTLPPQVELQVAESISLIAELDFPHDWPTLVDELVNLLSQTDFVANKPVLLVAHSIFKRWRPLFRSDELFLEIKLVLEKFTQPFMLLLQQVDEKISSEKQDLALLNKYFEILLCLLQLYYDFNCQDIPEFFEDNMKPMMTIVHKYLSFTCPLLEDASDDETVNAVIKCKTLIIELVSLYVTRYADVFEPLIDTFISSVWQLVTTHVTKQSKYDLLVVKALRFLASVARNPQHQSLFDNKQLIHEIIEKIVLPNIVLRQADEEAFEDDPIQFTRSDVEGLDFDSRRKATTDLLKELKELNTALLTSTVMTYVSRFLTMEGSFWKNKDTATYLFSSLAAKGQVTHQGVASTNALVDVVLYFGENVATDLVNTDVHPILKMDAIKYICTFRNQLDKEQLMTTIPLFSKHLDPAMNPVVYTYAAIAIEKLLEMTDNSPLHSPVFTKTDIAPHATTMLLSLFSLILARLELPEKVAENEFLMKCVWRVTAAAQDALPDRLAVIEQLVLILRSTLKNPSNPKFSHYTFEAIASILKFGLQDVVKYIDLVIPELLAILSEDVQEFVPYTFQILAFLLESLDKEKGLPETYVLLIKPLLSPSVWEFRGNVPGITRLLIAILEQDCSPFANGPDSLTPLLGVFQKLISSKLNDNHGFDLLLLIILNVPMSILQSFLNPIAVVLLTRLKNARTDKYVKRFVLFLSTLCTIHLDQGNARFPNASLLNCDFVIEFLDSVQPGVFAQIYTSFVLQTLGSVSNLQDKKVINLAVANMLQCATVHTKYPALISSSIDQLATNIESYDGIAKNSILFAANSKNGPGGHDLDADVTLFGSHFSKLISILTKAFDPVPGIKPTDSVAVKKVAVEAVQLLDPVVLSQISEELRLKLAKAT